MISGPNFQIMLLILLTLALSLFIYLNSLYFTLALLALVVLCMLYLVYLNVVSRLTAVMLAIIYIGAIIVLIGYICAVSPNLNIEPNSFPKSGLLFIFISFILFQPWVPSDSIYAGLSLADHFYSVYGVVFFLTLVLMLFVTLLMVTSQYLVPKGPFRSV